MKLERISNSQRLMSLPLHSWYKKTQLNLLLDLFYCGREELCWSNRVLPDQREPLIFYRILRKHGVQALEDFQKFKWVDIICRSVVTWVRPLLINWHSEASLLECVHFCICTNGQLIKASSCRTPLVFISLDSISMGLPILIRICLWCRRPGFDPWVRKIPWRREWLPTPVFLPEEFHGQRSLAGYKSMGSQRVEH